MLLLFPNDGRKLKKCITALLKAKLATEIFRYNYIQSYTLQENTIGKEQKKLIFIQTTDKEKVLNFLQKQFPEAQEFAITNLQ